MKLTALAVVILALGIVLGFALAGGSSGGPASAVPQCPGPSSQCPTPTPAPPQQREDQVVLFSHGHQDGPGMSESAGYLPLNNQDVLLALAAGDYPTGATFRFDASWRAASWATSCLRLFDETADTPVNGAEVCHTIPVDSGIEPVRVRSALFALPAEEHEYSIQGRCNTLGTSDCPTTNVTDARVIVEWTE